MMNLTMKEAFKWQLENNKIVDSETLSKLNHEYYYTTRKIKIDDRILTAVLHIQEGENISIILSKEDFDAFELLEDIKQNKLIPLIKLKEPINLKHFFSWQLEQDPLDRELIRELRLKTYYSGNIPEIGDKFLFALFDNGKRNKNKNKVFKYKIITLSEKEFDLYDLVCEVNEMLPVLKLKNINS